MRDRTNISDALENHEENKNKDLSSTSCEFVSLECTPQVRYSRLTTLEILNLVLKQTFLLCLTFISNYSSLPYKT